MSYTESSRAPKTDLVPARDRDWKPQRDVAPHMAVEDPDVSEPSASGGSLRARIGDKKNSLGPALANSYRPDPPSTDDDRDNSRKRTVSGKHQCCMFTRALTFSMTTDREKDASDSASGPGTEQPAQPQKRLRINRNRYQSSQGNSALVKKLLQTEPQAGDKSRSGRKD
jgi:THO complex subunit 2